MGERRDAKGEHASVLVAGDDLLLLTSDAELFVAAPDAAAFTVGRHYEVADGATWAMPVPLPDGLLIRDATSLARLVPASQPPG